MTTTHKLRATIPHGPKDMGAEIEVQIRFVFLPGCKPSNYDPGWPAEIQFGSVYPIADDKPCPFEGSFADLDRAWLSDLAEAWLESDEGQAAAMAEVTAEAEDARAFIAELRRES